MKKFLMGLILLSSAGLIQAQMCFTLLSQTACQAAHGCSWDGASCNSSSEALAGAKMWCQRPQTPGNGLGSITYQRPYYGYPNSPASVQLQNCICSAAAQNFASCNNLSACKWTGASWTGQCLAR
jgi:hypothetical protein